MTKQVNLVVTIPSGKSERVYELRSIYRITDLLAYLPVGTEIRIKTVEVLDWTDDAERIMSECGFDYEQTCE